MKKKTIKDIVTFIYNRGFSLSFYMSPSNRTDYILNMYDTCTTDIELMVYRWWRSWHPQLTQHKDNKPWVMEHVVYGMLNLNYLRERYGDKDDGEDGEDDEDYDEDDDKAQKKRKHNDDDDEEDEEDDDRAQKKRKHDSSSKAQKRLGNAIYA